MTTLPHICAICCTYGRTSELAEAVACFHAQDYPNKSLVIFNSLNNQTIIYEHPEVKVVNSITRPTSMGATRNEAIKHAPEGCLLVTWDDDDRYCSRHLANFSRGFDSGLHGWSRHSRQFHMEAGFLKSIVHGSANTVAFTKAAWEAVGGYIDQNTGEDQQFIGRLTAKFSGITVDLKDDEISFCYGWAQGAIYHLSGGGPDKVGHPNGMVRCGDHVRQRQEAMYEPTGEVRLQPKLLKDYDAMARKFTTGITKLSSSRRGKIAIVSLGHAGDLMNVLPIALHIYRTTGIKPMFFTSKLYGDVLDGVSYVEAVKLDLPDKDIKLAIAEAEKRAEYVLPTQVHGDGYQVERICDSYNEEAWRMAGMLPHFGDTERFPLVFDKRRDERERVLLKSVRESMGHDYRLYWSREPRVLLYNLTGGYSSPFSGGTELAKWIEITQTKMEPLNLSNIRAERIYDMLAILERGTVLVTSDTYTVHLAAACDIPVIAILNDNPKPFGRPWLRTKPRCNCILELGYSEALSRIEEINQKIGEL